jgi:hypothetical protein
LGREGLLTMVVDCLSPSSQIKPLIQGLDTLDRNFAIRALHITHMYSWSSLLVGDPRTLA